MGPKTPVPEHDFFRHPLREQLTTTPIPILLLTPKEIGWRRLTAPESCLFGAATATFSSGSDFGELLATMGVLGWAGLVTIPTATGLLVLWGAATMFRLTWRRRTIKKEREL